MNEKATMEDGAGREGVHLRVAGKVQGVGFRPAAWRVARRLGLGGWVRNDAAGAEVLLLGNRERCGRFLEELRRELPGVAGIEAVERRWPPPAGVPEGSREEFAILESPDPGVGVRSAGVLPDLATCPECLREMADPKDRRYLYPFTNCTACGPRSSILLRLPYDRPNTTMGGFRMCKACEEEYRSPGNRRFHAQPNACPACGPRLEWAESGGGRRVLREEALEAALRALREGKIVAVKGIGGFHLMVDARDAAAVARLRHRKRRESKPLAVMYPSMAALEADCAVSVAERRALGSPEAPIVLVWQRAGSISVAAEELAPGLPWLGVFLPYSSLHHLLLRGVGFPLVATSGNLTNEPICTGNEEALARLDGVADAFLLHDRPIARPLDDSVVAYGGEVRVCVRRGRGMAPYSVPLPGGPEGAVAAGGELKNAPALCVGGQVLAGPHVGDLEHEGAVRLWGRTVADLMALRGVEKPRVWVADAHPGYASAREAERAAESAGVPCVRIAHHAAHVAGCMAENGVEGPALGIAWDGTGWSGDGVIRGGEFLSCENRWTARRVASLREFPLAGGDAAAKEPRRTALGIWHELGKAARKDGGFAPEEEALVRSQLRAGVNVWRCSSAGRLFDAFAALLGVCAVNRHEGEAPMRLEAEAWKAAREGEKAASYPFGLAGDVLDWEPMWREAAGSTEPVARIALRIHATFAAMMRAVARREGVGDVCLSGGCFQNRLLLRMAMEGLAADGFRVHVQREVPPNDAGVGFGQLAAVAVGREG